MPATWSFRRRLPNDLKSAALLVLSGSIAIAMTLLRADQGGGEF